MSASAEFERLLAFIERLPAVQLPAGRAPIGHGRGEDGRWWVKFGLDIRHELAWQVVQELGHVLNYLSADERLPTSFKPVSPPPYMNGGPERFLSWVVEGESKDFGPSIAPSGSRVVCHAPLMIWRSGGRPMRMPVNSAQEPRAPRGPHG
jgi:hypothetical protein